MRVPRYLGAGKSHRPTLCNLHSKWEAVLSLQGLQWGRNGPISLSQSLAFLFLAHIIILGREEFSGFIEECSVYGRR